MNQWCGAYLSRDPRCKAIRGLADRLERFSTRIVMRQTGREGITSYSVGDLHTEPTVFHRVVSGHKQTAAAPLVIQTNYTRGNRIVIDIALAEASGSRTHRRRGNPPPAGFEDHLVCSDGL
jgi:hypothetical protein